ncbi:monovalent cation/H+ antiporter subunit D family protein [Luteococcus sp. Sow4_B9]|uniref:monovalent cation/H+ antiporter subunit D family protein n=1 Tax=Luteococcus sp. Sow4_B9 TaxID=3438792 RepID=UPI003F97908A
MSAALLPLMVAIPLGVAALVMLLRPGPVVRITVMMTVLVGQCVWGAAHLWHLRDGGTIAHGVGLWPGGIAIPMAMDAFSALMLTATMFLMLVCCWLGIHAGIAEEPYFTPLVLVLAAGISGALVTADIFNLFVFIEVMLMPSYALIILAHRGQGKLMQVTATRIYVVVNLFASNLLLLGVGLLYGATGTVNMGELAGRGVETARTELAGSVVLLALCIKAAVVPVHGWVGRTYPHMSPTISAMFSGLHTKVAVYAMYRVFSVVFGGWSAAATVLMVLFCLSMVLGGLLPLGETDARAVLSVGMISQIGYVLAGLALFTPAGIAAGVFYLVHNMVVKTSLLCSIGAVELTYGRSPLGTVRGLLSKERVTALVFFAAAVSLVGMPPLSGFVAKFAIVVASFQAGQWVVGGLAIAVSALTLMAMMKIWGSMFLGNPDPDLEDEGPRIGWGLIGPALVLALVSLAMGLGGQWLLQLGETVAQNLLQPTEYARVVSGR